MRTRSTPSLATATTVIAAVLSGGLLLSGCSGDSGDAAPGPSGVSDGASSDPATSRPVTAVEELSAINCKRGADGWTFAATLTNAGKQAMVYSVSVVVATKDAGKVLGSKDFTETLGAGKSAKLSAANFYTGTEKDVSCVPNATKAEPAG